MSRRHTDSRTEAIPLFYGQSALLPVECGKPRRRCLSVWPPATGTRVERHREFDAGEFDDSVLLRGGMFHDLPIERELDLGNLHDGLVVFLALHVHIDE